MSKQESQHIGRAVMQKWSAVMLVMTSALVFAQWPAELPSSGGRPTLSPLLKKVTPAVVNVGVQGSTSRRNNPLYNDPFFRRFFNVPEQAPSRPRQSGGAGVIGEGSGGGTADGRGEGRCVGVYEEGMWCMSAAGSCSFGRCAGRTRWLRWVSLRAAVAAAPPGWPSLSSSSLAVNTAAGGNVGARVGANVRAARVGANVGHCAVHASSTASSNPPPR